MYLLVKQQQQQQQQQQPKGNTLATISLTIVSLAIVAYILTQMILSVRDRINTAAWEADTINNTTGYTVSTSGRYADWSRVDVGTGSAATARHAA